MNVNNPGFVCSQRLGEGGGEDEKRYFVQNLGYMGEGLGLREFLRYIPKIWENNNLMQQERRQMQETRNNFLDRRKCNTELSSENKLAAFMLHSCLPIFL